MSTYDAPFRPNQAGVTSVWTGRPGSAGWNDYYNNTTTPRTSKEELVSESGSDQGGTANSRKKLVAAVVIITLLLVGAIVGLLVVLLGAGGGRAEPPPITPESHMPVTMNLVMEELPFVDGLNEPDSAAFNAYEDIACDMVDDVLGEQDLEGEECDVMQFSPGSVVVLLTIQIRRTNNSTEEELRGIVLAAFRASQRRYSFRLTTLTVNYCPHEPGEMSPCEQVCSSPPPDAECDCYQGFQLVNFRFCEDIDECEEEEDSGDSDEVTTDPDEGPSGPPIDVTTGAPVAPPPAPPAPGGPRPDGRRKRQAPPSPGGPPSPPGGPDGPDEPDRPAGPPRPRARCGPLSECVNTVGSYECECADGYELNDDDRCEDINECDDRSTCQYDCRNTAGSYTCSCPPGYELDDNERTCSDKDECDEDYCEQECDNTPGSFRCYCEEGYFLNDNKLTCSEGTIEVEVEPDFFNLTATFTGPLVINATVIVSELLFAAVGQDIENIHVTWRSPGSVTEAELEPSEFGEPGVFSTSITIEDVKQGRYSCQASVMTMEAEATALVYKPGCGLTQFGCQDGSCVSFQAVCDSKVDCATGFDELICCPPDQFHCGSYRCIPVNDTCDGVNDCDNWSDEQNCPDLCALTGYTACSTGECIPEEFYCDGKQDCESLEDESSCTAPCTVVGQLECDGKCVSSSLQCDGIQNCVDNSDEQTCTDCFSCTDGSACIANSRVCDGVVHCTDASDETDRCTRQLADFDDAQSHLCFGLPCLLFCYGGAFECECPYPYYFAGNGTCVFGTLMCDGIRQFSDYAIPDETPGCQDECESPLFQCDDKCIVQRWRCDGIQQCVDGTDEQDCSCEPSDNRFQCDTDRCLPISYYCDGEVHCADGTDEPTNCRETDCPLGYFKCVALPDTAAADIPFNPVCLDNTKLCNGEVDCPTRSDEFACGECDRGLPCDDGIQCFPEIGLCDGRVPDCADVSDELSQCPDRRCNGILCDNFCFPVTVFCDGAQDCSDGSDEPDDCLEECAPSSVDCDGQCLAPRLVCDGRIDCPGKEDELDCGCEEKYQCDDGVCLEPGRFCDLAVDCADESDESEDRCTAKDSVPAECPSTEGMVGICIEACSEDDDCDDDELCCSNGCGHVCMRPENLSTDECPDDFHQCDGRCLSMALVCDGNINCRDASDESECAEEGCNKETDVRTVRAFFLTTSYIGTDARPGSYNTSCESGMCVSIDKWCNGQIDCDDGSDERPGCDIGCPDDAFHCKTGECIPQDFVCDGIFDCYDKSDEIDCEDCPSFDEELVLEALGKEQEFWTCKNVSICLPKAFVCNGEPDCPDGSDESSEQCCRPDNFHCLKYDECVPFSALCNGFPDCKDNSDEYMCPNAEACSPLEFECANHQCVPMFTRCDNFPVCFDGSDERFCEEECPENHKRCDNGFCLPEEAFCNGFVHCLDGSDEIEERCKNCSEDAFRCKDTGFCVDEDAVCDGKRDCDDYSDEADCGECEDDEFQCDDPPLCRPYRDWCDREKHCPDGSDEKEDCGRECKPGQMACDGRCVSTEQICDGVRHCSNYADERGCSCPWGTFQCRDRSFCPNMASFCDGIYDCQDHSDEPEGCLEDCPIGHYECGDECRDIAFICKFPDMCPEVVRDLTCSSFSPPSRAQCGVPAVRPAGEVVPFIIDGEKAVPGSYPWQIVLEFDVTGMGSWVYVCSGSIISEEWVLTAAHCVIFIPDASRARILAGTNDQTVTTGREQHMQAAEIIMQPRYSDYILTEDIALIRLRRPLDFNDRVSAICLSSHRPETGTLCTISGWGLTKGTDEEWTLNQANMAILDQYTCVDRFRDINIVSQDMICSGKVEKASPGCQGDSGGPLICPGEGEYYVLSGVVSWGSFGCKHPEMGTVYHNVAHSIPWIMETTGILPVE